MSRKISLIICFFALAAASASFAQSGRVKTNEKPTPTPRSSSGIVYAPTEKISVSPDSTKAAPKTDVETNDEVISVESNLVPIPVSVFDPASGRAVTNLKLEDFLLSVDGKAAEISDLSRSETPVRLALLFDNSSSVTVAREFEKKAAVKFFRRVIRPEKDLASLFSVATAARLEQSLTKDVSQLVAAIERFAQPEGATALLDGIIKAAQYLREAQSGGRLVIVIVSDGDDTISDAEFEDAVKSLQVNNCQVFVVKTTDFENYKRTGQRGGNANLRQLAAERRMQEIARQTGGAVYSPLDEAELDRAFNQISAELAQQYVLSYYSEDDQDKRGEFRAVSLKLKNNQNLTVRARKGYYVPKK